MDYFFNSIIFILKIRSKTEKDFKFINFFNLINMFLIKFFFLNWFYVNIKNSSSDANEIYGGIFYSR